jgi:hypothetical protein
MFSKRMRRMAWLFAATTFAAAASGCSDLQNMFMAGFNYGYNYL